MERRVKERLIGASILVALVVLVVPELLSGPKPARPAPAFPAAASEPLRNVTVDLSTSKAASPDIETATASAPAPAVPGPGPASAAILSPAPAPANATPPEGSSNAPAMVETPAISPISTTHASWAVQLGSFASRSNAENLVHQLKAQGFSAYILSGGSGSAARYRVRIGPHADREAAQRTAAKLKSLGHESSIIAPAA
jgi:DedD protein